MGSVGEASVAVGAVALGLGVAGSVAGSPVAGPVAGSMAGPKMAAAVAARTEVLVASEAGSSDGVAGVACVDAPLDCAS